VLASSRYDRLVDNYLFTPLIRLDKNLQPIPGLADSWEISDDGLVYRFELNKKATFSDGTPVLAGDVLFTLTKIADPKSEALQVAGAFEQLDLTRSRVIDNDTVEVAFRQPLATQLVRFNDVNVIPEHVYSKGNFRTDFTSRAVGSGPYVLVKHEAGKEVVVERRKDYWEERPHIQTVVLKVINDHGTAFNALKRGDIDETIIASDTWLREHNNPETTRTIDFQRFYTLNYNFIGWNNRNPMLADKRVRRALTMCIPIDTVIQDIFHGTARAMTGPFTPDEWAYNPSVPVVRYDLEGARKLFTAAGWLDRDGDGVLEKDGKPFAITLQIIAGSATSQQFAQLVQAELKRAGVKVEISMLDGAMAIQRMAAGNYDAAYLSWDLDPDPDPFGIFHSSAIPPRGQNYVFYSNPEADRLIDQARHELDQSKRKDLYWRLHEILAEDQPYTWVVQVSAKWGINKRVKGAVSSRGMGFFSWYPGELGWWITRDHLRDHNRGGAGAAP
jgi:peptide/nickel transport system substrate-binding protein